jgi:lysophospholipase L1-like esterase
MHKVLALLLAVLLVGAMTGVAMAAESPASAPSPSAKYEKEIAAFEAADRKSPPPTGAILFIGDSGIRMWKSLAQDFPDQHVINRGFGGSQMIDSVYFADRIAIPYKPRLIVIRAGGNDLTAGKTPEQLAVDFAAFVEEIRAALPDTRIVLMSLNPNPARWNQAAKRKKANALLREYIAKGKNLDFVEIWDQFLGPDGKPREDLFIKDGLHNNPAGYKIMAEAVRPHLK